MGDRKLSKRLYLTVVWQDRHSSRPTPGYDGGSPIYTEYLHFRLRWMHRKGSNRPKGYYHDTFCHDGTVTVRWLWTEEHKHFAPEVTFSPTEDSLRIVRKLTKVMEKIGKRNLEPETLCEALEAMIVESVENEAGAYDDYRPVRLVGEPAMVTLARAAL